MKISNQLHSNTTCRKFCKNLVANQETKYCILKMSTKPFNLSRIFRGVFLPKQRLQKDVACIMRHFNAVEAVWVFLFSVILAEILFDDS